MFKPLITQYRRFGEVLPTLQRGDIIEFLDAEVESQLSKNRVTRKRKRLELEILCTTANEWCVYIGKEGNEHEVVRCSKNLNDNSDVSSIKQCTFTKSKLSVACAERKCRRSNGFDMLFEPKTPEEIVVDAMTICHTNMGNFHPEMGAQFALKCRYGVQYSAEIVNILMHIVHIVHYDNCGFQEAIRVPQPLEMTLLDSTNEIVNVCKLVINKEHTKRLGGNGHDLESNEMLSRPLIMKYQDVHELIPELRKGDLMEMLDFKIGEQLRDFRLPTDELETETISATVNEWCVYLGEQDGEHYVAHITDKALEASRAKLVTLVAGRLCRRNNSFDLLFEPRDSDEIVEEIISPKSKKVFLNSEQFAAHCRYGILGMSHESTREVLGLCKRVVRMIHHLYDGDVANMANFVSAARANIIREVRRQYRYPDTRTWYTAEALINQLTISIGDMVEFDRDRYRHWGVYVGRTFGVPMVVHKIQGIEKRSAILAYLTSTASVTHNTQSEVLPQPLAQVAGDGLCRVNNLFDRGRTPLRPLQIVTNAFQATQEDHAADDKKNRKYNVINRNCEHFASLCRYGEKKCSQVDDALHVALFVGYLSSFPLALWFRAPWLAVCAALLLCGHGLFFFRSGHQPPGVRRLIRICNSVEESLLTPN